MASLVQLQLWLGEAETARHALAMGEQVVEVWKDGRRITYSAARLPDLEAYIKRLERDIEQATKVAAGKPRRSAIGFHFG
ncbi:MAG: gpW family head-tail joining protein [Blastomonas fulva]|uniref:gpW family head-tail joining protein n=1 Tax=Blastomonas fulva TaxID=1550728 RepID=UPI0040343371